MPSEARGGARGRGRGSRRFPVARTGALVGVLILGGLAGPAPAELIERILAAVDGRPVLLSEVELLGRVRGLARPAALEAVIDEVLMYREASRLPQAAVSPEEEERAWQSLLTTDPDLARSASEDLLRQLARRQATILKYVGLRFGPQVRISDEEVAEAYRARHAAAAEGPPLSEVAESLRERLARRALDEKIEAWIAELRQSADLRYNP